MTPNSHNPKLWWSQYSHLLTSRRLSYAWLTGAALWLSWLLSITLGPGNLDLANQAIGTDYLQFYASGLTLARGASSQLYDFVYQAQLEKEIIGPDLQYFHANLTPPFLAWVFVPLSSIPYAWSFAAWSGIGLLSVWASLRILGTREPWRKLAWALSWFPVFASISFGQNSLLSLLFLCLTYLLWQRKHKYSAGLVASLLLYKPQLLIGVAIIWLIQWRREWKSFAGLLTGGCILAGLTFISLPEAAMEYLHLVRNFLPGMIYSEQFPLYHLHALRGFLILLLPGQTWLVETISIFVSITGLIFYLRILKSIRNEPKLQFVAAICSTIFITPHAMIYDWVLLLIPAVLLWQAYPELKQYWKVVFAGIWLVSLLSGPLTFLQLKFLPVAVQISVPIYLILLIDVWRVLKNNATMAGLEYPMKFQVNSAEKSEEYVSGR
ncbi:MAG TPA: glycosyltransferase family 87 protein [Anaerolineales bacterium]|nr:glycosyltransferase family 87 protein [Anaerolineales bacterium]